MLDSFSTCQGQQKGLTAKKPLNTLPLGSHHPSQATHPSH